MKEDIADQLRKDFEEDEIAIFYALLRIAILAFLFGIIYIYFT